MKNDQPMQKVQVWDLSTRLFHWVLVVLFALSSYSAFQDKFGSYADIHLWSGYGILLLVGWRIIWGFVGSDTARFGQFVKSPKATLVYAKSTFKRGSYTSVGHNPLGAWSVVAMLLLLAVQVVMGLFASDGMFFSGPYSNAVDSDVSGALTSWHRLTGYVLLGLVGLHLSVILFYGLWHRANLVWPMITGYKVGKSESKGPAMKSTLYAFGLFAGLAAGIYYFLLA